MLVFQYHDLYLVTVKKPPGNSKTNKNPNKPKKKNLAKRWKHGKMMVLSIYRLNRMVMSALP